MVTGSEPRSSPMRRYTPARLSPVVLKNLCCTIKMNCDNATTPHYIDTIIRSGGRTKLDNESIDLSFEARNLKKPGLTFKAQCVLGNPDC